MQIFIHCTPIASAILSAAASGCKALFHNPLESWEQIIDSISTLPNNEQKKILQGWKNTKLETAQDIFLDYPLYEYDFDSEKYKKSIPERRKSPNTD